MSVTSDLALYAAIGFAAQIVDGAIGMAYGLTATTVLMSFGVTAATASASVHAAEIFTTAASGTAHWRLGNINLRLVKKLAIPGMVGGAIGAYILATVPSTYIRPLVSTYLIVMGFVILWRAVSNTVNAEGSTKHAGVLGFVGGFLDSIGGGGWGAMITTTLIGWGIKPRFAIGSANAAEFFVTVTITATFVATVGLALWPVITGLIIGGVIAAPLAAYATKKLPEKPIMIVVAIVVMILSLRNLLLTLA
jgi:uncharacterized membrane protein YfcA